MNVIVEAVPASVTFPLRQQVLRPHESFEQLALPGDDDPDSCHVVARTAHGQVVGTATVRREAPPWEPGERTAWRLRGMATSEGLRGQGIGTQVLDALIAHVASHGGGLLWCNARIPAKAFYERAGFVTRGESWIDPDIGPHVAMWRNVELLREPSAGESKLKGSQSSRFVADRHVPPVPGTIDGAGQ